MSSKTHVFHHFNECFMKAALAIISELLLTVFLINLHIFAHNF